MMDKNYLDSYVAFLKKFFKVRRPLRVVFDCSNGTTGPILQKLFKTNKLITYKLINSVPDGRFPVHGPNPLASGAMDGLCRAVRRERADLGVIFDADGDRAFFVDDQGRVVPSGAVIALLAGKERGAVVLTVDVGFTAREFLAQSGRRVFSSVVGHTFIKKEMRRWRATFGAEQSGHYYFKDFFFCDSGIFAAIQTLNQIANLKFHNVRLSGWTDALPKVYSSGEMNFRVKDKNAVLARVFARYHGTAKRISRVDGVRMEFGQKHASHSVAPQSGAKEWWFILRPSNTEPLLRLTLEAKDKRVFAARLKEVTGLIKK